jgi:hypothetical protein
VDRFDANQKSDKKILHLFHEAYTAGEKSTDKPHPT